MSAKGLSKRRLKKQLRYATEGFAIGIVASLTIILGAIMLIRLNNEKHIGHRVPSIFGLFAMTFLVLIYRFWRLEREPEGSKRLVTRAAVTELSEGDKTKSA